MSRQWASGTTAYLTFGAGVLAGASRPFSGAILMRLTSGINFQGFIDVRTSGGTYFALIGDSPNYFLVPNGTGRSGMAFADWSYVGFSIPSATGGQFRWHIRRASLGTWTHANGGTISLSGTIASIRIGFWDGGHLNGLVAAAALWNTELSDAAHESNGVTAAQAWYDNSPAALWLFNQANVSDTVLDVTGNGSDQTATTGTMAVSATEPPGWSYTISAGSTDLTAADAAHSHSADSPALTQVHNLTAADASHGHAADQPTVTQVHTLTPDSATHSHSAESPALTQAHQIAAADAGHAQQAGSPTLSQTHALAAQDATHAHTAAQPALTQAHQIAPDAAEHAQTADAPALTQAHGLAPDGAAHGQSAAEPTLGQAHQLTAASAAHGHEADQPALAGGSMLLPDPATHSHSAASPTLTQAHALTPVGAVHAHLAGMPALTQLHLLAPAAATHVHTTGQPDVTTSGQTAALVTVSATASSTTASVTSRSTTASSTARSTTAEVSVR